MVDISELNNAVSATKGVIELMQVLRKALPKSEDAKNLSEQLERAETALRLSNAKVARSLGYDLCECTFPPQIMLWREKERAHVCPNPECGKRHEYPEKGESVTIAPDYF